MPGLAFPVIRDLVVDMTQFYKQYWSIKPYLINHEPPPEKERLQSPGATRVAQRPVRMHHVRMLFKPVPVVLVESGQIRWAGRAAKRVPLYCR